MTVDHHTYLIACLDGKPVGYVSVQPLSEKEDGLDVIELHVNRHNQALGFYEHQGMRKLRQGDYPIGQGFYMNDYIMGLELKEK